MPNKRFRSTVSADSVRQNNDASYIITWYTDSCCDLSMIKVATNINRINETSEFVVDDFILQQNYPHTFNPTTKINYTIPEMSIVILKVYDVLGNEIATLVSEEKPVGSYEVEFSAKGGATKLSSGIYFYKLQAGNFVETKKMILLK